MTTTDYFTAAGALRDELVAMRRDFHRHPELGFEEVRTAGIVAQRLGALGLEVQTGVGRTGVVGVLECDRPGPVVMVRCDMDALPVQEDSPAPYASETPGVMHACGHDGHTAIGLAVARLLAERRAELPGTVKFVFQPAEEGMGGAEAMIQDGVLASPRPAAAFGLHLWNPLPAGKVGVTAGPMMAAAEILRITLAGRGGHGASPHETGDPIVAAAQVVSALQSVVSRNVAPLESAVVSITSLHAGTAFNVIPGRAELLGTIRTLQPSVREVVLERVRALVTGMAPAMGVAAQVEIQPLTPAVVNDPDAVALVREAAAAIVGAENVVQVRTMGSEDMSEFLNRVPGCFFFVGSADAARGLDAPHHNARFDFDESALVTGTAILCAVVTRRLREDAA